MHLLNKVPESLEIPELLLYYIYSLYIRHFRHRQTLYRFNNVQVHWILRISRISNKITLPESKRLHTHQSQTRRHTMPRS